MHEAHQCPKCDSYIIGDYCYLCNIDIRNYIIKEDETVNNLKDILGIDDE